MKQLNVFKSKKSSMIVNSKKLIIE